MWPRNYVDVPELEDIEFDIPPRSVLYRIPALGDEAGQIEGLLSYVVRLAREHSVRPRRLIRTVYAASNPSHAHLFNSGFFINSAGAINGLGKTAELMLGETEKLTGANFLRNTCLLPLKELFPFNGVGMLANKPKWCPLCISEMTRSDEDVYHPLLWSFKLYQVCLRHKVHLHEVCHACGSRQPFIPQFPDLGRCDHCGEYLGKGKRVLSTEPLDQWISAALNDLVMNFKNIDEQETANKFRTFIAQSITTLAGGNRNRFCRHIGLSKGALNGWLSNQDKLSMPQFLSICYALNLMPSSIFLCEPNDLLASIQGDIRMVPKKLFERKANVPLSFNDRQRVKIEVNNIIEDPENTKPLSEVARSLGISRTSLLYWFPDECMVIVIRHATARKLQIAKRVQAENELVISVVQSIKERGEHPSYEKVNFVLCSRKIYFARQHLRWVYKQAMSVVNI